MTEPTNDVSRVTYVLVEEEATIRQEWLKIAASKDILLMTYPDPEWFLSDLGQGRFREQDRFYLDQDFGEVRGVGIHLARAIKNRWSEAYACLVTAYPKFLFRHELAAGVINDVFGKYPSPFDKPEFTAFEQEYERKIWVPLLGGTGTP